MTHVDAEVEWFIRIDYNPEEGPVTGFGVRKPPNLFHSAMLKLLLGWRVRHITDLPSAPPIPFVAETFPRDEEYERSTQLGRHYEVPDE